MKLLNPYWRGPHFLFHDHIAAGEVHLEAIQLEPIHGTQWQNEPSTHSLPRTKNDLTCVEPEKTILCLI